MKRYSELELNKMIAELEGLNPGIHPVLGFLDSDIGVYDPLSVGKNYCKDRDSKQKAILFDLTVKYKVDIIHEFNERGFTRTEMANTETKFKSGLEIPRAIIMCILKSKNIIKGELK